MVSTFAKRSAIGLVVFVLAIAALNWAVATHRAPMFPFRHYARGLVLTAIAANLGLAAWSLLERRRLLGSAMEGLAATILSAAIWYLLGSAVGFAAFLAADGAP